MFGKEYVSQHVWQTYAKEQKTEAWQLYVAETLHCISESTAKFSGGSYITAKWSDIINPKPAETRTPEQVINQVLGKLKEIGGESR